MVQEFFQAVRNLEHAVKRLEDRLNAVTNGFGMLNPGAFNVPVPTGGGGTGIIGSPLGVTMWLNDSGGDLFQGDVVRIKIGGVDRGVEPTTSPAELDVIGVLDDDLADGANGRVRHIGFQFIIHVQGAVAPGDFLISSSTMGRAASAGAEPVLGAFAMAQTAFAGPGAGDVSGFVFPPEIFSGAPLIVAPDFPEQLVTRLIFEVGALLPAFGGVLVQTSGPETVLMDASLLTDGAATVFETEDFFQADSVVVFQQGLMLQPGVDFSEGADLGSVILTVAPTLGDVLLIQYVAQEA